VASIREIVTDWVLPSGSGHVSVMYFDTAPTPVSQRAFINNFWNSIRPLQAIGCTFNIRTSGRELDETTGTLTGAWAEPTVFTASGTSGSVPVPDTSQMLVQWRTGTIVGGRFLRGRTFVPALGIGQTSGGNVIPSAMASAVAASNALVASSAALQVWHRPISGSGGSAVPATSSSIWSEFAFLRRRRG